ncbi:MAG: DUF4411 family protein [Ignavibacteriaceae bacterium]|nr:DUF4411 family protein [Ignavibacteriaceae bacterium]
MKYVFDTGPFIDSRYYFPDIFKSYWNELNKMAEQRDIISVKEVYNELLNGSDIISDWAKQNKDIFEIPNPDEFQVVTEILSKHKELVRNANFSGGSPVADPFVIAKAQVNDLIVVTLEIYKEHAHKIPNICQEYDLKYMSFQEFMINEKWAF